MARCMALKADGRQCINTASGKPINGVYVCGIPSHVAQATDGLVTVSTVSVSAPKEAKMSFNISVPQAVQSETPVVVNAEPMAQETILANTLKAIELLYAGKPVKVNATYKPNDREVNGVWKLGVPTAYELFVFNAILDRQNPRNPEDVASYFSAVRLSPRPIVMRQTLRMDRFIRLELTDELLPPGLLALPHTGTPINLTLEAAAQWGIKQHPYVLIPRSNAPYGTGTVVCPDTPPQNLVDSGHFAVVHFAG